MGDFHSRSDCRHVGGVYIVTVMSKIMFWFVTFAINKKLKQLKKMFKMKLKK